MPLATKSATSSGTNNDVNADGAIPKHYVLTDLGAGLPGSPGLVPSAINDQGVVVGSASVGVLSSLPSCNPSTCGPPEGWIFKDDTLSQLPALGSDIYTFADDINSAGTVSGGSAGNSIEEAVLWSKSGQITNLGTGLLGSQSSAEAIGISNSHKIVGISYDSTGEVPTAFRRDGHASAPCGSSTQGYLNAVNNSGLAAGVMPLSQGGYDAITCAPLTIIESPPDPTFWDLAFDLNDKGQVVGRLSPGPSFGNFYAFLYRKGSTTNLGTLFPSDPSAVSDAFSINASGAIVGFSAQGGAVGSQPPIDPRAFIYASGKMVDLNSLLPPSVQSNWTVVVAESINDKKQVAAAAYYGGYPYGVEHAVLLSPEGGARVPRVAHLTQTTGKHAIVPRVALARIEALRQRLHLER